MLAVGDLLTGGTLACGLLDVVVSVFSRCIWGEPGERRSREVDGVITALAVYGLVVAGLRTEEAWSDRGCDDDLGNRFFDVGGMCGALLVIARYICGQTERVAPDAPPPPIQAWPAPVAPAANPPAPQPLQAVLVADPEASLPGSPNGSSAERSALESLPGSRED